MSVVNNPVKSYDAWAIRRILTDSALNGELQTVSERFRPVADHLASLSLEVRQTAWEGYLSGQDDSDRIILALAEADPSGPPPKADERRDEKDSVTLPLSTLTEEQVVFLWPGRVPLKKLTLLAGEGGVGKTFFIIYMIATITNGDNWFDGSILPERGSAIFISSEDDAADTLMPRLRAAGADLSKVRIFKPEVLAEFTLNDLDNLYKAAKETKDLRLVVIDPVTAHLGGINDNDNSKLRALLTPLAQFAKEFNAAVVLVTHFSKSARTRATDKILGSVGWVNQARSVLMCANYECDEEEGFNRIMLVSKCNLAKLPPGITYRIAGEPPRLEWGAAVDANADELLGEESGKPRGRKPEKSISDANGTRIT